MHLYRRHGNAFTEAQTILPASDFTYLGRVWLGRQGLVINYLPSCDFSCSRGRWRDFRKDAAGVFQLAVDSLTSTPSAAASHLRRCRPRPLRRGQPRAHELPRQPDDNVLAVFDTNPSPIVKTFESDGLRRPNNVEHEGWYRKVDLSATSWPTRTAA